MTTAGEPLIWPTLTVRSAWKALGAHSREASASHLRDLFAGDPKRGHRMNAEADGIFLDPVTGTDVMGNFIGTDATGTQPLGNASDGGRQEILDREILNHAGLKLWPRKLLAPETGHGWRGFG